jgi:hypothetical protein
MPTTAYLADTYVTPFDPAYVDLWGTPVNNVFISHDAAIGRAYAGGCIISPVNSTIYGIAPSIRFPCTVKSVKLWTDAGTVTVASKIGSTVITSLSAVAVTSTPARTSSTGANTMSADNDLNLVCSSVSGVGVLYYSYYIDRTGAGTA